MAEDTTTTVLEEDWFDAEANGPSLMSAVRQWAGERTLHCLDLFSKSGMAYWEWHFEGFYSAKCDVTDNLVDHDILSRKGFKNILELGLSLMVGGIALAGPPCSMFIFLSSSMHQRTLWNPLGDTSLAKIRMANMIAKNTVWLLELLTSRGCFVVVEQPLNSVMYRLKDFTDWMARDADMQFYTIYMSNFGHEMLKPTRLLSNMKAVTLLLAPIAQARRALQMTQGSQASSSTGTPPRKFLRRCPSGPAGGRDLHESATYTRRFVAALLSAWEREFNRVQASRARVDVGREPPPVVQAWDIPI